MFFSIHQLLSIIHLLLFYATFLTHLTWKDQPLTHSQVL
jgi:hypothetical protein